MIELDHGTLRSAYDVALQFVARRRENSPTDRPDPWSNCFVPPFEVMSKAAEAWRWDDDTPLVEVPLCRESVERESGGIIISTVKSLPPVLTYCTQGPTFASQVTSNLLSFPSADRLEVIERYLISPLEPILKVRVRNTAATGFVRLPDRMSYLLPPKHNPVPHLKRDPCEFWSKRQVEKAWKILEKDRPVTHRVRSSSRDNIVSQIQPVQYNQSCNVYRSKTNSVEAFLDGNNYCTPRAISGCTPVAWAMLASSLKRRGVANIWPGSQCWDKGWSSFNPGQVDPTICGDVSHAIWGTHTHMGTGDDGGTTDDHIGEGGNWLTSEYNLPTGPFGVPGWLVNDVDMGTIRGVISSAKPLIFCAQGQWSALWTQIARELGLEDLIPKRGAGIDGHCVLAYGYATPESHILACMGWGTHYPDRWLDIGAYSDGHMIYNEIY
jgi:hypothetical protein